MKSFEDYLKNKVLSENNYYIKIGKYESGNPTTDVVVDTEQSNAPLIELSKKKVGAYHHAVVVLFYPEFHELDLNNQELTTILKLIFDHCANHGWGQIEFNDQMEFPKGLKSILNQFVSKKIIKPQWPDEDNNKYFITGVEGEHDEEDERLMPNVVLKHQSVMNRKTPIAGAEFDVLLAKWMEEEEYGRMSGEAWQPLTSKFEEEFQEKIKNLNSSASGQNLENADELVRQAIYYWNKSLKKKWPAFEDMLVIYFNKILYELDTYRFTEKFLDYFMKYFDAIPFSGGQKFINNMFEYYSKENPGNPDEIPKYYSDPRKRVEPEKNLSPLRPFIYDLFHDGNLRSKYPKFKEMLKRWMARRPELGQYIKRHKSPWES